MEEDTKLQAGDLMLLIENFPINYEKRLNTTQSERSCIEGKIKWQLFAERLRVQNARKEGKTDSTLDTCKKIVRLK